MENIIIIGAGGFALEIVDLIHSINMVKKRYNIYGLLDDKKKEFLFKEYKIIGKINDYKKFQSYSFVIAIANPQLREDIYLKLKNINLKTPNLFHPKTEISKKALIERNSSTIINFDVQLCAGVELKECVIVDSKSYIGHETILNSFVTIYPGVKISGKNIINRKTEIGLGSNIIQGLEIGSNSFVGAGSTVIKDIRPNVIAVGIPCKEIKER